jgi:hypothetical protein
MVVYGPISKRILHRKLLQIFLNSTFENNNKNDDHAIDRQLAKKHLLRTFQDLKLPIPDRCYFCIFEVIGWLLLLYPADS